MKEDKRTNKPKVGNQMWSLLPPPPKPLVHQTTQIDHWLSPPTSERVSSGTPTTKSQKRGNETKTQPIWFSSYFFYCINFYMEYKAVSTSTAAHQQLFSFFLLTISTTACLLLPTTLRIVYCEGCSVNTHMDQKSAASLKQSEKGYYPSKRSSWWSILFQSPLC